MRIVFIGTGDIGVPSLQFLLAHPAHELVAVVAQPDKPAGRKQELHPPATKVLAQQHGIPVLQPARIKAPDALEQLNALRPDLIVVMAYGQILPRTLLDLPPVACLNLHASLLPRHRGAAPIQAAILAGENETGITVMYMDEGLDTGDILLMDRIPITATTTGGSLHDDLAVLAPTSLGKALDLLVAGNAPRTPQDPGLATHAPKLSRDNGHIAWENSAAEIDRQIRAFDPWPGTYSLLRNGEATCKLKIHKALLQPASAPFGAAGAVRQVAGDCIAVSTSDGVLLLTEVQLEGKRRMSAADFLRGHSLHPHARLE